MAWTIDPAHSQIEFTAKHMMFTTVRGHFSRFSGTLTINEADPTRSFVEGEVETASLDTRDANRDGHLRSPDFFDVETFPAMRFHSKRLEAGRGGRFNVTGDLTIRDVTREVTFEVTDEGRGRDPWGNERRGFSAQTTLNRKDFGLTWNVALETGGWLVGDEIRVFAEVQAIHQPDAPATETVPADAELAFA